MSVFLSGNLVYAISHPKYRQALKLNFPWLVCISASHDGTGSTSSLSGHGGSRRAATRAALIRQQSSIMESDGSVETEVVEVTVDRREKAKEAKSPRNNNHHLAASGKDGPDHGGAQAAKQAHHAKQPEQMPLATLSVKVPPSPGAVTYRYCTEERLSKVESVFTPLSHLRNCS